MSCALLGNLVATWVGVSQCPVRGGWCVSVPSVRWMVCLSAQCEVDGVCRVRPWVGRLVTLLFILNLTLSRQRK